MNDKQPHFFPRSRIFWFCHTGAMLLLVVAATALFLLLQHDPGRLQIMVNIGASVVTVTLLTFSSLFFRWLFYRYGWQYRNTVFLVMVTIGYSIAGGLVTAFLMVSILWEWFLAGWPAMLEAEQGLVVSYGKSVIRNWFYTFFEQAAWLFVYVTIVVYRRAQKAELDKLRLQNSLREAQMNTLIGQINPHFIFNGLNNIRSLMLEDRDKARHMITALSDMLRASLSGGKQDRITLEEELETVRNYVDLAGIQFEERLRYQEEIKGEVNHLKLPPMILQMLVENAIKHGIGHLKQGGEVLLSVEQADGMLNCEVRNHISQSTGPSAGGYAVGLSNIRNRLELLYGDRAYFDCAWEDDQFVARLCIPETR